jgi:ABC-type glycerol-3-phosphate transport system permease component
MIARSWRAVFIPRLVLVLALLLVIVPLIYQLGISLKPPARVFENPISPFAFPFSLENYAAVLRDMPLLQYFANSLLFALGVTLGQLALALPAAFAFSFYHFPGKNLLMGLVVLSLMVPFVVTYVPNYLLIAQMRLVQTIPGMVLPMMGVSLGFGIFLLRQNFLSFSSQIVEAAMIDGANSWQILWWVVAPANRPAIVAVSIYVLINTWNQFIWPLLIGGGDPDAYTLTVAVQLYYANPESGSLWGALMAASVMTSLPTILIYLFMRKSILRTFSEGAVKG